MANVSEDAYWNITLLLATEAPKWCHHIRQLLVGFLCWLYALRDLYLISHYTDSSVRVFIVFFGGEFRQPIFSQYPGLKKKRKIIKHGYHTYSHSLRWRHNERDSVSNHRRLHCLLNCWFRRRSKKTSQLRVTGFCAGKSQVPGNSLHKRPVKRKCFHLMTSSCDQATTKRSAICRLLVSGRLVSW